MICTHLCLLTINEIKSMSPDCTKKSFKLNFRLGFIRYLLTLEGDLRLKRKTTQVNTNLEMSFYNLHWAVIVSINYAAI